MVIIGMDQWFEGREKAGNIVCYGKVCGASEADLINSIEKRDGWRKIKRWQTLFSEDP